MLNGIFKREANRVASSERGNPTVALSAAGQAGLQEYLEGPVRNQLRQEWGDVPEEFAFVYGHTHKPFTERRAVAGFPSPVSVANTGGWVVDTATPAPVQGGVAVLVNDDLETASLQFYRQGRRRRPGPVPAAAGRRAAVRLAVRARSAGRPGGGDRGPRCPGSGRGSPPSATGCRPPPSRCATPGALTDPAA